MFVYENLTSYSKNAHTIAWNRLNLLRILFLSDDPLTPVDIVITHPSCLANVHLSAIVEQYEGGE